MGAKKTKAKAAALTGCELVVVPVAKVGNAVIRKPARYIKARYKDNLQFQQEQEVARAAKAESERQLKQLTDKLGLEMIK